MSLLTLAIFMALVTLAVLLVVSSIRGLGGTRRLVAVLAGIAFCLAVFGISRLQEEMIRERKEHKLTDDNILENAPPIVAFTTIALGGFRGLLADILFLRSEAMKERQQYFELVQLADMIVQLQPRFTGAIAFLAWNMAYNVSVTFTRHEDRWRWVNRGVELIRDKGLLYHPNDPLLYRELGWIYQHKMGNVLDDAHRHYKVQLAAQMTRVTGAGWPVPWDRFADAPNDPDELAHNLGPTLHEQLLRLLTSHQLNLEQVEYQFRQQGALPEALATELDQVQLRQRFEDYLRSRWLREGYRLEPEFVDALVEELGALDFRLPEAHAVYWARQGLAKTTEGKNLECERMVFQSLHNAFMAGRLIYVSQDQVPFIGPNVELVDAVRRQYLDTRERHLDNRSIMSGYENFMKNAIVILYTAGRRAKAEEFRKYLVEAFPHTLQYRVPIDTFALRELGIDISGKSAKQIESILASLLVSYYGQLAVGDEEAATATLWIAMQVQALHNQDKAPDTRHWDRVAVQDIGNRELRLAVLRDMLQSMPPDLATRLKRALNVTDDMLSGKVPFGADIKL